MKKPVKKNPLLTKPSGLTKLINVRVEPSILESAHAIAKREGLTVSQVVREALVEFIGKGEKCSK